MPDLINQYQNKIKKGEQGKTWEWHLQELQDALIDCLPMILKSFSIWIFIDALDECGKENAVDMIEKLKELFRLVPSSNSPFHMCFTCRHYPTLDRSCEFEIATDDNNNNDISTLVKTKLSDVKFPGVSALITASAASVFMWARLVVEKVLELDREGYDVNKIKAEIRTIPPESEDLYRELIRTMGSRSLKLIQWICFARRPLSLDELRWAMVVEAKLPHQAISDYEKSEDYISQAEKMARQVQTLSHGLAEVTSLSEVGVVQFIHQTVKDFFLDDGFKILDRDSSSLDMTVGRSHSRLSRIFICYMSAVRDIAWVNHDNHHRFRYEFPLLEYAVKSWADHTQESDAKNCSQEDLLDYLRWPSNAFVEQWTNREGSLIHLMASYQMPSALTAMLKRANQCNVDINLRDKRGHTPLFVAARHGQEAAISLLLNEDKIIANPEEEPALRLTPLVSAIDMHEEGSIKALLKSTKTNVEHRIRKGRTALSWAVQYGTEANIRLLIAVGNANVNSRDNNGLTPLTYAAQDIGGNPSRLTLLLETDKMEVNSVDNNGKSALSYAAAEGHTKIVKALLKRREIDVNLADGQGQTPLSYAAEGGLRDMVGVVKELLERGDIDVNLADDYGLTPLMYAVNRRKPEVLKELLKRSDVDVNVADTDGKTALSYAEEKKHDDIITLLQQHAHAQGTGAKVRVA